MWNILKVVWYLVLAINAVQEVSADVEIRFVVSKQNKTCKAIQNNEPVGPGGITVKNGDDVNVALVFTDSEKNGTQTPDIDSCIYGNVTKNSSNFNKVTGNKDYNGMWICKIKSRDDSRLLCQIDVKIIGEDSAGSNRTEKALAAEDAGGSGGQDPLWFYVGGGVVGVIIVVQLIVIIYYKSKAKGTLSRLQLIAQAEHSTNNQYDTLPERKPSQKSEELEECYESLETIQQSIASSSVRSNTSNIDIRDRPQMPLPRPVVDDNISLKAANVTKNTCTPLPPPIDTLPRVPRNGAKTPKMTHKLMEPVSPKMTPAISPTKKPILLEKPIGRTSSLAKSPPPTLPKPGVAPKTVPPAMLNELGNVLNKINRNQSLRPAVANRPEDPEQNKPQYFRKKSSTMAFPDGKTRPQWQGPTDSGDTSNMSPKVTPKPFVNLEARTRMNTDTFQQKGVMNFKPEQKDMRPPFIRNPQEQSQPLNSDRRQPTAHVAPFNRETLPPLPPEPIEENVYEPLDRPREPESGSDFDEDEWEMEQLEPYNIYNV